MLEQDWVLRLMPEQENVLDLIREQEAQAFQMSQRGAIFQPGAIGDCILTLPLAKFIKDSLGLGGIDIFGHTEYLGIFPGRTCVDTICSIELVDLHRLFVCAADFELVDGDALIGLMADYSWIVSFLGEPDSDFEQNLIFTANCSRSAEVMILSMKPPPDLSKHVSFFYVRQFINQCGLSLELPQFRPDGALIKATDSDIKKGRELLSRAGIRSGRGLVVIHPGSGGLHKCWHADNFLAIAKELVANGLALVFLVGPAEMDRFDAGAIARMNSLAPCLTDLSLTEVLQVLACAGAFLGNDSGTTHLAAALGVRTAAVFGPTDPNIYRPIGPAVSIFVDHSADFTRYPSPALQNEILTALIRTSRDQRGCIKP